MMTLDAAAGEASAAEIEPPAAERGAAVADAEKPPAPDGPPPMIAIASRRGSEDRPDGTDV